MDHASPALGTAAALGLAIGVPCSTAADEQLGSSRTERAAAEARRERSVATALPTVVVTAPRRSENLQEVAMAVSAFDGAALRDVGAADAMQLQLVVPSLTYVATGYAAQPYLRGIGTRQSPIGMEPSVATFIDNRYVTRPFAAMFDLLDIERVEVVRGPQGMLYGRNAAGGAIRAITRDPGSDLAVEVAGKVGEYEHTVLRVLAGGPLSGALRAQIAAGIERRDGLSRNLVSSGRKESDDLDRQVLRGKLLWDIGENVSARLGLSWWRFTDWMGRDLTSVGVPEANQGVALYGGVTSRDAEHFASALTGDNDLREAAADLRFDVDLGNVGLRSITTYTDADFIQTFDVDASSARLIDLFATERSTAWSQELQLTSSGDRDLSWLVGLVYYHEDGSNVYVFQDSVLAPPQFPSGTDVANGLQAVDTEAHAAFGRAVYAFDDRWSISLGGRWSSESKDAVLTAIPGAFTNAPTPFVDSRTWDKFTPHVSIARRGRFGLAYLSYSRGFKSGGYNYPASLSVVLDPETLDSYELGLKSDMLDGRLRLNAAVFSGALRDLQVTRGGAGAFLATENAADGEIRGVEIELDFALTETLAVSGGVTLMSSEYTDYTAGVLIPLHTPPYGSTPLEGGLDVRGRSLLRAPDQALYVAAFYEHRLAGGGRVPVSFSYAYKGDYYFDFSATAETEWLKQEAYGVVNMRVGYAAGDGRWEIGFWGTNLTDERYYEDAVLNSVSSRVSYADPRTFGMDFKLTL